MHIIFIKQYEKYGNSANVNAKKILLEMRSHRMGLIQTPEQLRFSYMAIIEGIKTFIPKITDQLDDTTSDNELSSIFDDLTNGTNDDPNLSNNQIEQIENSTQSELRKRTTITSPINGSNLTTEKEERAKMREERRNRTYEQICRIKEKQKEVEARSRLNERLSRFTRWGLAAVLVGSFALYFWNNASNTLLTNSATSSNNPLTVVNQMTNNSS